MVAAILGIAPSVIQPEPASAMGACILDLNTEGLPQDTPLQGQFPLILADGIIEFTAEVQGANNWANGVQIQIDPAVGTNLYVQPNQIGDFTASPNKTIYTYSFPNPVEDFTFIASGLNFSDTNVHQASLNGVNVPIDTANYSNLDPAGTPGGTDGLFATDLDGDGLNETITGTLEAGGTEVTANVYTLTIPGPIDELVITTGKAAGVGDANSVFTVTEAFYAFGGCVVEPSVSGTVEQDTNKDGTPDGPLDNVTVNIYDATGTTLIDTTQTNALGDYTFTNLDAITSYVIEEVNPAGYASVSDIEGDNDDRINVDVGVTNVTGQDFVDRPAASISGTVREDTSGDSIGDTNVAGVTINLYDATGTTLIASVPTGPDGAYEFSDLDANTTYVIREVDPTGYISIFDVDGANDNEITVPLGTTDVTAQDFVDEHVSQISGFVQEDTNNDDVADSPIENAIVTLFDATGTIAIATTQTGADGSYTFANVLANTTYIVRETDPAGMTSVSDVDGGNDNQITIPLGTTGVTGRNFLDEVPPTSAVAVAKSVSAVSAAASGAAGHYDVTYRFTVENTGQLDLSDLSLVDDMSAQLGATFAGVVTAPTVTNISATSPPAANGGYAGTDDLLAGAALNQLRFGEQFSVDVTIEVDANGVTTTLTNQATITGSAANGDTPTDLSDSGTTASTSNQGAPGDSGGMDDPTPLSLPRIAVTKTVATAAAAASGTLGNVDVVYAFVVRNTGVSTLSSLSLTDDMATQLGGAFVGVVTAPAVTNIDATSAPTANATYAGTSDLLAGAITDELAPGQSYAIEVEIEVDLDGKVAPLENQATAGGIDSNGLTVTDLSDDGTDPTSTNPGEPGDAGTADDPTPLEVPLISVAKDVGIPTAATSGTLGNFDVPYTLTVENVGLVQLSELSLTDDLVTQFGGSFVQMATGPQVINVDASNPPAANGAYTGVGDMLIGAIADDLDPGQSFTVTMSIELDPDASSGVRPFTNQATVQGTSPSGATVTDLSDTGTDPATGNPGEPGDSGGSDDPTPVDLPSISVAKRVTGIMPAASGTASQFDVSYTLVVTNTGSVNLDTMTLEDDIQSQFGDGFIAVASAPAVRNVDSTSVPAANTAYTGTGDMLAGAASDVVEPGQSFEVDVVIEIAPSAPGVTLPLNNQAVATGTAPNSIIVTDLSDNGADATTTNGTGGPNDPTPIEGLGIAAAKSVGTPTPAASGTAGNYDVPFTVTVQNTGLGSLNALSVIDDVQAQFGTAYVGVAVAPSVTNVDASTPPLPNLAYDGTDDLLDGALADDLRAGESFTVLFSIEIDADAAGRPTPLLNQATAEGSDPGGQIATDLTDSGTDPTSNNPGTPGDAGTSDDPTPVEINDIRVVKSIGSVDVAASGTAGNVDVTVDMAVLNLGNTTLTELGLVDDIAIQWGVNFVGVSAAPTVTPGTATSAPAPNVGYAGSADLLAGSAADVLEPGQTYSVRVVIEVDPTVPGGSSNLTNQATASGLSPAGATVTDLSDSGTDPATNNAAAPGDAGTSDDPTPLALPQIAVNKRVADVLNNNDGTYDVTYLIEIENTGAVELELVQVTDDLSATYATAQSHSVVSLTSSTLSVNAGFDGVADMEMLAGTDSLVVGAPGVLELVVRVTPAGAVGPFDNTAVATGRSFAGVPAEDLSNDGVDADPDADNDPTNNNIPTPVSLVEEPVLGLSKTVIDGPTSNQDGTYDVTYQFMLINTGNTAINNLQINDELSDTFGDVEFSVTDVSSPTLTPNASFDGAASTGLLMGTDTLTIGDDAMVSMTVQITPLTNRGPFDNTATANGVTPGGVPVQDVSQDGAAPDADSDGDPSNDSDPTPLVVPPPPGDVETIVKNDSFDTTTRKAKWTIDVVNRSPEPAVDPTITIQIPTGLTFDDLTVPQGWTCEEPSSSKAGPFSVGCSYEGLFSPDDQSVFVLNSTVAASAPASLTLEAVVDTALGDGGIRSDGEASIAPPQAPAALAFTGDHTGRLAELAAMLLVLGLGLVLFTRNRPKKRLRNT